MVAKPTTETHATFPEVMRGDPDPPGFVFHVRSRIFDAP